MCDATFGHVQTKEMNTSLQREGERQTLGPRDTRQGLPSVGETGKDQQVAIGWQLWGLT